MTAEQYLLLGEDPPGVRLELVEGEVAVSPSPTPNHGFAIMQLGTLLNLHVRKSGLGEIYCDIDTILNRLNVRRPDILFFSTTRTHLIGKKAMEGPPDLAVEVVSPSSGEIDRVDKFAQYAQAGVTYYWIVDPEIREIEAWRLDDGQYLRCGRGQGNESVNLPPFADLAIPLKDLWRP
jgi:Uma2 family endonuclease